MTLTLSKSNVMYVHGDSMGDDMQYIPHLINNSMALYMCMCVHVHVGVLTLLKFPYPRCVEEPETYDQVRVHAEWGAATSRPDSQKPTFAVSHTTLCTDVLRPLVNA